MISGRFATMPRGAEAGRHEGTRINRPVDFAAIVQFAIRPPQCQPQISARDIYSYGFHLSLMLAKAAFNAAAYR